MIRIERTRSVNFCGEMTAGYLRCHECGFKNSYRAERFVFNGCPECGGLISIFIGERPDWFTEEDTTSNLPQPNILAKVAYTIRAALERKP